MKPELECWGMHISTGREAAQRRWEGRKARWDLGLRPERERVVCGADLKERGEGDASRGSSAARCRVNPSEGHRIRNEARLRQAVSVSGEVSWLRKRVYEQAVTATSRTRAS